MSRSRPLPQAAMAGKSPREVGPAPPCVGPGGVTPDARIDAPPPHLGADGPHRLCPLMCPTSLSRATPSPPKLPPRNSPLPSHLIFNIAALLQVVATDKSSIIMFRSPSIASTTFFHLPASRSSVVGRGCTVVGRVADLVEAFVAPTDVSQLPSRAW
jgi:hypothetical protein